MAIERRATRKTIERTFLHGMDVPFDEAMPEFNRSPYWFVNTSAHAGHLCLFNYAASPHIVSLRTVKDKKAPSGAYQTGRI